MRYEIRAGLEDAGYHVETCEDGATATRRIVEGRFDLVVLDLGLPQRSGFEVLEAISGRVSTPVIVLTARTGVDERVQSFRLGAADYLAKPFFVRELLARVEARIGGRQRAHTTVGWLDVVVDLDARTVTRAGEPLALTRNEFNVLAWLVTRAGRAVTRGALADGALSIGDARSDRTVDSHVSRLRSKLGADAAAAIRTVWGVGYRFDPGS